MTDYDGGNTMDARRSKILIADDDEDILELVRLRLSRAGHEIVLARNGAEALELARSSRPDLALLDVTMPMMDGYQVTRELRADPATSHLPIVLLTARAQTAEVARGFEAGADDYVTKPFSPGELQRRVEEILAGSGRSDQPLDLLGTFAGFSGAA